MLHWFDPIFPVNLIYNFINCFLSIFIISIFAIKYKINKNFFFLIILTLIFPLLINGPFMNWHELPDQSKYLKDTMLIRDFEFDLLDGRTPILFSTLIFAVIPFPFIESFNDIGLINRLLFSLMIIFLINKKVSNIYIYFLLLSPSMILYTSTALKETLVVILTILILFSIIEKKNYMFVITLISLFLLKKQNAILIVPFFVIYKFYFNFNFKYKFLLSIILFIPILYFTVVGSSLLLDSINYYRYNFFDEETGSGFGFVGFINFLDVILNIPLSYIKFLIAPFPNIYSPVKFIFFIDSIILVVLLINNFMKLKKINNSIFIFWLLFFLAFLSMYSITIFNEGTISRYKISFSIPFLLIIHFININYNKIFSNEK
ncbi:MAG: hypothetical protein CMM99_01650 [Rickettsiales bacterium]|nr:hypothetical protein [Rickettsiales bacterium]|tara:strand:- start:826 stop:1950 length:1125 start_codon:yes stop_codon:yes gene_type:complete